MREVGLPLWLHATAPSPFPLVPFESRSLRNLQKRRDKCMQAVCTVPSGIRILVEAEQRWMTGEKLTTERRRRARKICQMTSLSACSFARPRSLSKGEKWVKNATLLAKCTGEEMECESLLAFSAKNVTSELNEGAIICDVPYEGGP